MVSCRSGLQDILFLVLERVEPWQWNDLHLTDIKLQQEAEAPLENR